MTIPKRDREATNQMILCLTISMMLLYAPITQFVNTFLIFLFWKQISIDSLILYGILFAMILLSFWVVLKRIKLSSLLLPLSLLLLYVLSAAFSPDARVYMFSSLYDFVENPFYWVFIYSVPAFLFIRRVWDYDRLFRYMLAFSIPALVCSVGVLILYLIKDAQPGYMSYSYDLLPAVIILMFGYFTKKKLGYLLGGLTGCFVMFFCGARGPVLCLCIAILLYVLLMTEKKSTKLLAFFFTSVTLLLLTVFWEPVFSALSNLAESIGINSRILEKISDGTFADDSGRSEVRALLLPKLKLFGYGLFGDRVITEGRYAHNIFIELVVQFGLLIGTALIILLLLMLVNGFLAKDREKRLLFIVFFSIGFVKLMMSSSYLSKEPALYCMLGICFSCLLKDDQKPNGHYANNLLISVRYRGRR